MKGDFQMQNTTPRHLLTASGLALLLALSPALAQDANSPAAEAAGGGQ